MSNERRRAPARWGRGRRTATYLIAWFAFLLAAVALTARFVPVTNHVVLAIAALSPYLMSASAVSALLLLLARKWWTATAAVILTAAAIFVESPLFVGSGGAPANSIPIRVLTANLREGAADPQALVAIAREAADVLIVEELTPELADSLTWNGLAADFSYKVLDARPYAAGVAIWSRYPIVRSSRVSGYRLGVVSAAIHPPRAAADAVVLAAHIAGPWPQPIDAWRQELAQFRTTVGEAAAGAGDGAVIVTGDFNASIDMQPLRQLLRDNNFRDAGEQSGAGLTPTFPADSAIPPFIAIDHILTSNSSATDAHTVRIPGSDHLGLCATVHVSRAAVG